jgi:mono/diheme cytochrome c family protein
MPQLGETVTEGTITKWFKAVGDTVAEDEPLFEVSTDKVDSEVPSPLAGTLTEIKVPEGETVDVGVVLAVIGDGASAPTDAPAAEAEAAPEPAPEAEAPPEPAEPEPAAPPVAAPPSDAPAGWQPRGAQLYDEHCAGCHGDDGRGIARAYVPLVGNPALLQDPPANAVQVVLGGAFAPTTASHPRPFGMPPFATVLNDADIAAVLSHARYAWGQQAPAVSPLQVQRYRGSVRP